MLNLFLGYQIINVNKEDITPIINKYNLTYLKISAKTNIHIEELLEY